MKFKKFVFAMLVVMLAFGLAVPMSFASGKARNPAIHAAAARVVEMQRTDDPEWNGTWFWHVGNTADVFNLTGVTALGLLEAYNDTKDVAYLNAAKDAAEFIMAHMGSQATGTQHSSRATAPDVVLMHRLAQATGDASYAAWANAEWTNLKSFWPEAADLDATFRSINRPSAWDLAFFMEAAQLSADATWAGDMAAIIANTDDLFYYGTDNSEWYVLNLAATIRALASSGYGGDYSAEVGILLDSLIALVDKDNGIAGGVQDAAYAVMAFSTVGGAATKYGNDLGRWLAEN